MSKGKAVVQTNAVKGKAKPEVPAAEPGIFKFPWKGLTIELKITETSDHQPSPKENGVKKGKPKKVTKESKEKKEPSEATVRRNKIKAATEANLKKKQQGDVVVGDPIGVGKKWASVDGYNSVSISNSSKGTSMLSYNRVRPAAGVLIPFKTLADIKEFHKLTACACGVLDQPEEEEDTAAATAATAAAGADSKTKAKAAKKKKDPLAAYNQCPPARLANIYNASLVFEEHMTFKPDGNFACPLPKPEWFVRRNAWHTSERINDPKVAPKKKKGTDAEEQKKPRYCCLGSEFDDSCQLFVEPRIGRMAVCKLILKHLFKTSGYQLLKKRVENGENLVILGGTAYPMSEITENSVEQWLNDDAAQPSFENVIAVALSGFAHVWDRPEVPDLLPGVDFVPFDQKAEDELNERRKKRRKKGAEEEEEDADDETTAAGAAADEESPATPSTAATTTTTTAGSSRKRLRKAVPEDEDAATTTATESFELAEPDALSLPHDAVAGNEDTADETE